MRLWSLHPKYLDQQGLCGLWREAIMARNAIEQGEEHGYYNHPQLTRFKEFGDRSQNVTPTTLINSYLKVVFLEGINRGFNFDSSYLDSRSKPKEDNFQARVPVTSGQVKFEQRHLCEKLEQRDPDRYHGICECEDQHPELNPLFYLVEGPKADWERG